MINDVAKEYQVLPCWQALGGLLNSQDARVACGLQVSLSCLSPKGRQEKREKVERVMSSVTKRFLRACQEWV